MVKYLWYNQYALMKWCLVTQEQEMLFQVLGPITTCHLTQGFMSCRLATFAQALMGIQTVPSQLVTTVNSELEIVLWAHHLSYTMV